MLPKTESEMFSKSLVGQMIFMIVPKKHMVSEERMPNYDLELSSQAVVRLLDSNGDEWIPTALFLVKEDAVFIGDVDAEGIPIINDDPEGFFADVDNYDKGIWNPRVMRDLIKKNDNHFQDLQSFLSQYVIERDDWRYIFPAELYNSKFAKSAINYQRLDFLDQ